MLQDFATVKMSASTQESTGLASAAAASRIAPVSANASTKPPATSGESEISEEDFEKQLQAGMADLLGELENSVRETALVYLHSSSPLMIRATARNAGAV